MRRNSKRVAAAGNYKEGFDFRMPLRELNQNHKGSVCQFKWMHVHLKKEHRAAAAPFSMILRTHAPFSKTTYSSLIPIYAFALVFRKYLALIPRQVGYF